MAQKLGGGALFQEEQGWLPSASLRVYRRERHGVLVSVAGQAASSDRW